MIRRLTVAALALFVLIEAGLAVHAWIPSSSVLAAGGDALLVDSGSSGSLRMDQLSTTSTLNSTDYLLACQSCAAAVQPLRTQVTQVASAVSAIITAAHNIWSAGQQIAPNALTDNSTIAVNLALSNIYTITLSGTNHLVQCPTGVTSGDWQTVSLVITQPSSGSPDNLMWDTCWYFNAGTPPQQSNQGLSAANGAVDMVTCNVNNVSGTYKALCGGPGGTTNLASSSQFVLRNNKVSALDSSGTGITSLSVTISNSMNNDLRTVEIFGCINGCGAGAGTTRATSVTDGTNACTGVVNSFYNGANGSSTDIWVCPKIVGSSTASITVTWPSAVTFPLICAQEWVPSTLSPDAGIGNTATGTTANPGYSTNGSTTQAGELIISMLNSNSTPTANVGTSLCSGNNAIAQYQTPGSLGVATNSATAVAGRWSASIAALAHY